MLKRGFMIEVVIWHDKHQHKVINSLQQLYIIVYLQTLVS